MPMHVHCPECGASLAVPGEPVTVMVATSMSRSEWEGLIIEAQLQASGIRLPPGCKLADYQDHRDLVFYVRV